MRYLSLLTLLVLVALPTRAQDRVITDDEWCDDDNWNRDTEKYCEVREYNLAADRNVVVVDGGQNGGIKVTGWDRDEILVRAKVTGSARSEEQARELADKVTVDTGRTIEANVPRRTSNWGRKTWVSVSFQVFVPHNSNLDLETFNGGLSIADVSGDVTFDVLNGGVSLYNLAGDVEGSTTNGGLNVELTGSEWDGEGLNVKTTNGGVSLKVPEDYSADLEVATVNGGLRFDFPVTLQGKVGRKLSLALGDGGSPVRVRTTNGSVKVRRS